MKVIEVINWYTPDILRRNPHKLFVFGDNMLRKGKRGQSIIRGLPNAFGIVTKKKPCMKDYCFMTDKEYNLNIFLIESDINKILNSSYEIVVFPSSGLGKDLAQLPIKAPKTYEFLKKKLLDVFGFNNDTGTIEQKI